MENKSATKTPKTERAWTKSGSGQNQEANTLRGLEQKGTANKKGTDPKKISPYKKYVVMITAA